MKQRLHTRRILLLLATLLLLTVAVGAQDLSSMKGNASYYSNRLHGRHMSNGERYNKDSMTCAHMKYPFGTLLRVTNLVNGREVVVKVTDRGPYHKRYIIDLSYAAAKQLGIIYAGFSPVEIKPYIQDRVPFLPSDTLLQVPELDLQYTPAATYPEPAWQRDSLPLHLRTLLPVQHPTAPSDTAKVTD